MTDARFPERWLNDVRFRRLPNTAFRTYVNTLLFAVANRTDGLVMPDDLRFVPDAQEGDVPTLIQQRLWAAGPDGGWTILDYGATQTGRDQLEGLERKKKQDAKRQQSYRDKKKTAASSCEQSRYESRDDIGQDRPGQARTGQDRQPANEQKLSSQEKMDAEWGL